MATPLAIKDMSGSVGSLDPHLTHLKSGDADSVKGKQEKKTSK